MSDLMNSLGNLLKKKNTNNNSVTANNLPPNWKSQLPALGANVNATPIPLAQLDVSPAQWQPSVNRAVGSANGLPVPDLINAAPLSAALPQLTVKPPDVPPAFTLPPAQPTARWSPDVARTAGGANGLPVPNLPTLGGNPSDLQTQAINTLPPPDLTAKLPMLGGIAAAPLDQTPAPAVQWNPDVERQAASTNGLPIAKDNSGWKHKLPTLGGSRDDQIARDEERLRSLQTDGLPHLGKWGRLLNGALYGLSHYKGQNGLGGALGAALGGAGVDFFSPSAEAGQRTQAEIEKIQNRLQTNNALKDKEIEQQVKLANTNRLNAETKSIPIDDENRRLQTEAQREAAAGRAQTSALTKLTGLKYFDPNNPAHKWLASQAGVDTENLKGWDDRNPIQKQVAGVWYNLNRQTGQYEPTSLPTDESKTLVDYPVTMPNGERRNFKVPQKDAANFATQMQALGET